MGSVQNFFTSRDNNTDPATYVGQLDRLWYNPDNNSIYVSNGSTPGGQPVALATGANITANNVTLNTVTSTTGNVDVVGNLVVTGDISYSPTFGCFHKIANVTANTANTVVSFDWYANTTAHVGNQGVTVTAENPTRVNIDQSGNYCVSVDMQIINVDNSERNAYVWFSKNGTDIAQTGARIGVRPAAGGVATYISFFREWVLENINANDYIELKFAVNNVSGISLRYDPAITDPYIRPAIPSAVLSVVPV